MNVELPGDESIVEFWLIMGRWSSSPASRSFYFRRRGWL